MPQVIEPRVRRQRGRPFEVAGLIAIGLGGLYFGQGIFIPLVLAILVAFALNPVVERLRRLGVPQMGAVLMTVVLVTAVALLGSYVMAGQLLKLAADLPQYEQTVAAKLQALQGGGASGPVGKLSKALDDLSKQVGPGATSGTAPAPIPVTVADRPASPLEGLTGIFGSILGPLATGTLVFIFSVFLLLERVELRDRFLKLVSLGDLRTSTKVMDESAGRVSRYLLVQFAVNCSFGILFGAGMFVLGVPNAVLWGLLAIVFRYIPFIGTFAAVILPATLAFAVDPGWLMLIGVVTLYLALELVTTNAIEPNLYGTSTGLSAMAVLIAAIFWATLWGLIGLVLATPLTVCLVVLGRHVPQLRFLDILLGSEPALQPEERFYQRLVAGNVAEAIELSEAELKDGDVAQFFDRVAVPALRLAEADLERDSTDLSRRRNVVDAVNAVVEEFDSNAASAVGKLRGPALVIAGKTEIDGAAARMLVHSLATVGIDARYAPPMSLSKDGITQLDLKGVRVVVVCYLEPRPQPHVRYAAARLRRKKADVPILACLLGVLPQTALESTALRVDDVALSISETTKQAEALLEAASKLSANTIVVEPAEQSKMGGLRRFAAQNNWIAATSERLAEEFKVSLGSVRLATRETAPAGDHFEISDRVIAAGEPILVTDATLDKETVDDAFLVENGLRSFMGVPLKTKSGEVIGTVTLYDTSPRDFGQELGRLIQRAAEIVAQLEAGADQG